MADKKKLKILAAVVEWLSRLLDSVPFGLWRPEDDRKSAIRVLIAGSTLETGR
jgi:hypothetical protein